MRSPTHGAAIARTVKAKVALGTSTHGDSNNAVWNYLYSDATTGCMNVGNSVEHQRPLYVKGSLCMSNSATFTGYQLEVGGSLSFANSSQVGTSTNTPVHDVHVARHVHELRRPHLQPAAVGHAHGRPDEAAHRPRLLVPERLAGAGTRLHAGKLPRRVRHERRHGRQPRHRRPRTEHGVRLQGARRAGQRRSARSGGHPSTGILTISGTVFIDGSVSFANLDNIVYKGRATIYASGTVSISNQSTICGVAGCDASWDANQNLLAFVAG